MSRFSSFSICAGLASVALFCAAQQTKTGTQVASPKVNAVPIQQTPTDSGQRMFSSYCAACHGADGTGNGPAAQALKVPPTDLTLLSQKNKGVFPSNHVAAVLQFGVKNPAHGTAAMPVWGNLMRSLNPTSQDAQVNERVVNLTSYLKQIQK